MNVRLLYFLITIQNFIPDEIRKAKFVTYMAEVLGYVDVDEYEDILKLADEFFKFKSMLDRFLPYNGQLMILESALNRFQPSTYPEATITIEDATRSDYLHFHNVNEPYDDVFMHNADEVGADALYMYNKEEYEAEVDFIVRVHLSSVSDDHKLYIRSIVDKFKIAGKTYSVLPLEE